MSRIGADDAFKKTLPPIIGDNNDDDPGQPIWRHKPWAWGEDPRDAGEESQWWLSHFDWLSQVLEKFMSTVPENTNYQQQVLFESTFKAASWPSLAEIDQNANFGPNLVILGQKILISIGKIKSFVTHIITSSGR